MTKDAFDGEKMHVNRYSKKNIQREIAKNMLFIFRLAIMPRITPKAEPIKPVENPLKTKIDFISAEVPPSAERIAISLATELKFQCVYS